MLFGLSLQALPQWIILFHIFILCHFILFHFIRCPSRHIYLHIYLVISGLGTGVVTVWGHGANVIAYYWTQSHALIMMVGLAWRQKKKMIFQWEIQWKLNTHRERPDLMFVKFKYKIVCFVFIRWCLSVFFFAFGEEALSFNCVWCLLILSLQESHSSEIGVFLNFMLCADQWASSN